MRKSSGQVALALNLFIAIFVVGSIGLVTFEISRILLAREQLQHCLELAALGGSTTMASSSQTGAAARTEGQTAALNILKMNSILGQPLTTAVVSCASPTAMALNPGQVGAYIEFDDPVTKAPAAASANTCVIRVYGAYAYSLFSGGFGSIGVSVYTISASASAGLPAIDVVLVYNNDSSNDDQTPVSFVRRYWDPSLPAIAYLIPDPSISQSGTLFNVICGNPIGSAVNGLPPQNLDAAGDKKVANCPKQFSEVGNTGNTVPLRGTANTGTGPGDAPPGIGSGGVGIGGLRQGPGNTKDVYAYLPPTFVRRCDPMEKIMSAFEDFHLEQPAFAWYTQGPDFGNQSYNPWNADPTMFTDLVVNIDGNATFAGLTTPPNPFTRFSFPTLDFLVESSRGNMESSNIGPNVHVDNNIAMASQPGYLNAYQCLAYKNLQPKATIEGAIINFMNKMQQSADVHFGLVTFNDRAGTSPSDTFSAPAVSWAYPVAGNVTAALPTVPLNTSNNNSTAISTLFTPPTTTPASGFMTPNGGSCLAAGLTEALSLFTGGGTTAPSGARQGAFQAIVVITDKVPDRDTSGNVYSVPTSNATALSQAIAVAQQCNQKGIPIFMVTVGQNVNEVSAMQTQFDDTAGGAGLVGTAGNGGTLSVDQWIGPTQTSTTLTGRFNNVVRQLMTLVGS